DRSRRQCVSRLTEAGRRLSLESRLHGQLVKLLVPACRRVDSDYARLQRNPPSQTASRIMSVTVRRIAHLDMDAFYASVELLRYPELRGKAVVIGGGRNATPEILADGTRRFARLKDYAGRGVVTTSTYEARAFGVFSAMGMMKAAQLAPDAIL